MKNIIGILASILLLILSWQKVVPIELKPIETIAVITSAWSVWLLAQNKVWGWWIGLIGVITYAIVFYQVKLYGEVGLQIFYLLTSLQAIYIWLKGGQNQAEKPISKAPRKLLIFSAISGIISVYCWQIFLTHIGGASPFWDALTTVVSIIAQLYLMQRYLESWYLWVFVDIIYIPLYTSRGLYLTTLLYAVFLLMAIYGGINFHKIYAKQHQ